jgi:hypothetical protein
VNSAGVLIVQLILYLIMKTMDSIDTQPFHSEIVTISVKYQVLCVVGETVDIGKAVMLGIVSLIALSIWCI